MVLIAPLIRGGIGVGRGGEADLTVGGVKHGVVPFEESVSIDEVETFARVRAELHSTISTRKVSAMNAAHISNDQVVCTFLSADLAIQRAGEELCVWRQGVGL